MGSKGFSWSLKNIGMIQNKTHDFSTKQIQVFSSKPGSYCDLQDAYEEGIRQSWNTRRKLSVTPTHSTDSLRELGVWAGKSL